MCACHICKKIYTRVTHMPLTSALILLLLTQINNKKNWESVLLTHTLYRKNVIQGIPDTPLLYKYKRWFWDVIWVNEHTWVTRECIFFS